MELVFSFFSVSYTKMQESGLEMGKRPSRQRRHLPSSIAPAAASRNTNNSAKHIPLLGMSFQDEKEEEKEKNRRRIKRATAKKRREPKQQAYDKRKLLIWLTSIVWIIFILYRIVISFLKEDYGNLSIVHFISNVILNR
ncbi:hypothetical protein BDF21DRAFT_428970 [Thamnidium elegans]|nr:hypothetical protein BDF21DRAFT_428970 [Thamnidium elegans]